MNLVRFLSTKSKWSASTMHQIATKYNTFDQDKMKKLIHKFQNELDEIKDSAEIGKYETEVPLWFSSAQKELEFKELLRKLDYQVLDTREVESSYAGQRMQIPIFSISWKEPFEETPPNQSSKPDAIRESVTIQEMASKSPNPSW